MFRLLGCVARPGMTLRGVLGEDSFAAFAQLFRIHEDSWGLAYVSNGEVSVRRSTACAYTAPAFQVVLDQRGRQGCDGAPTVGRPWPAGGGAQHPCLPLRPDRLRAQRRHLPAGPALGASPARVAGVADRHDGQRALLSRPKGRGRGRRRRSVARVAGRLAESFAPSSLNAMPLTPEAHSASSSATARRPGIPRHGPSRASSRPSRRMRRTSICATGVPNMQASLHPPASRSQKAADGSSWRTTQCSWSTEPPWPLSRCRSTCASSAPRPPSRVPRQPAPADPATRLNPGDATDP